MFEFFFLNGNLNQWTNIHLTVKIGLWYLRYWPIPIVFTFSKHFGEKNVHYWPVKLFVGLLLVCHSLNLIWIPISDHICLPFYQVWRRMDFLPRRSNTVSAHMATLIMLATWVCLTRLFTSCPMTSVQETSTTTMTSKQFVVFNYLGSYWVCLIWFIHW